MMWVREEWKNQKKAWFLPWRNLQPICGDKMYMEETQNTANESKEIQRK